MINFRIADTFTDSLSKLSNEEQKAVKTTAFDLQLNPASPGMQFHRIEKARDPNFWSIRVNLDIRLIVHKTKTDLLLCYVGHHDDAYYWAERRKLETHPKTGAAQLVEIREVVREIAVPKYVEAFKSDVSKPKLFADIAENDFLSYGIPGEWISDVREATEDSLFDLVEHLPQEAGEALLDLATGVKPRLPEKTSKDVDALDHPDAQRRFRVMNNVEELERALKYPWEKWTIFLHPDQKKLVEQDFNGPVRISGTAGTGKTIVALHRAVYLARSNPDARVLLSTFSDPLANALRTKMRRLISNEPRIAERLEVHAMNAIGRRIYELNFGPVQIASIDLIQQLLKEASQKVDSHKFRLHFLMAEWEQIVDARQLKTWKTYRDVIRLGRKIRLPEKQRAKLWEIFEHVRNNLQTKKLLTYADLFSRLAARFTARKQAPFDFTVIDESQDISIPQLKFFSAMAKKNSNSLFFTGDLGQRIFQQPFSWKALGVDIRGRSQNLRINYRTSHQIRIQADRLLSPELSDVDGNREKRRDTISVFNGPKPDIEIHESPEEEIQRVGKWISERKSEGTMPHEMGIFVRSSAQLERACSAVKHSGLSLKILDENIETVTGHVSVGTMHLAKGLEFRAVVVMACDDEIIPLQNRIETVSDDTDLEEVYNTERHLLYVACTRAREHLLVTGVEPASEFLDDMKM